MSGDTINSLDEISVKTSTSKNQLDYQKCCKFSKDGKIFIAGTSDGVVTVWNWPTMTQSIQAQKYEKEIVDVDIATNSAHFLVATPDKLRVSDVVKGKIRWVGDDLIVADHKCSIRAARYY